MVLLQGTQKKEYWLFCKVCTGEHLVHSLLNLLGYLAAQKYITFLHLEQPSEVSTIDNLGKLLISISSESHASIACLAIFFTKKVLTHMQCSCVPRPHFLHPPESEEYGYYSIGWRETTLHVCKQGSFLPGHSARPYRLSACVRDYNPGSESHSPWSWFSVTIECNIGGPGENVLCWGSYSQTMRVGRSAGMELPPSV